MNSFQNAANDFSDNLNNLNTVAKQLSNELTVLIPPLYTLASVMPTICHVRHLLLIYWTRDSLTQIRQLMIQPLDILLTLHHSTTTGHASSDVPAKQFPKHLPTTSSLHRSTLGPPTHHSYYSDLAYQHLHLPNLSSSLLPTSQPITLFLVSCSASTLSSVILLHCYSNT